MKIAIVLAGVALGLAASSISFAQSSDATYCTSLTDTYNKYVLTRGGRTGSQQQPPADISVAMSKCGTDAKSSIPILEKALKDEKVNLPPRG